MQTWIITGAEGEEKYLPFIGVYNYTGPSKKYTNSYTAIDYKLKPKFLCGKLTFRDSKDGAVTESYFKQAIDKVNETFPSNPDTGVDAGNVNNNNRVLYIVLAASISVVLAVLVVVGSYFIAKKSHKKEEKGTEELEENKEDIKQE